MQAEEILKNESGLYDMMLTLDGKRTYEEFRDRLYAYFHLNSFVDGKVSEGGERLYDVREYVSKSVFSPKGLVTVTFDHSERNDMITPYVPHYDHTCYYVIGLSVTINNQEEIKKDLERFFKDDVNISDEQREQLIKTTPSGARAEKQMDVLMGYILKLLHLLPVTSIFNMLGETAERPMIVKYEKLAAYFDGSEYLLQSQIMFCINLYERFSLKRGLRGSSNIETEIITKGSLTNDLVDQTFNSVPDER